ncbi:MAG: N-methyl-D-aspartate receptor NMDAR2C subunit [Cyanobacteria bacterium P01_H01_bin.105]
MNSVQTLSLLRWQRLCAQFNIDTYEAAQEYKRIVAAYRQSHRAYHTAQHINECLTLLDWVSGPAQGYPWLEMALWYHDVVYQPRAHNNEQQSADWAVAFLQTHDVASIQIERVESLIMATSHTAVSYIEASGMEASGSGNATESAGWLVDIDLAILGAAPPRFLEYDDQIRQEYSWVPEAVYRAKRQVVLSQFLQRPVIYQSDLFRERFEAQARENLEAIR